METLTQIQKRQNKELFETAMGQPREQLFAFYVSWHPKLYEGVDLDMATIDYINNHFYEYKVDTINFDRHFMNALRHATPIYNNMKAIEFSDRVFNIITNKSVRKLAKNTIDNIKENGTINKLRKDTGTITDSGTAQQTGSETQTDRKSIDDNTKNKVADKQLPMQSLGGEEFEELFDWSKGASTINESENDYTRTENNSGSNSTNINTTTGNIRTLATNISNEDTNELTKISNLKGNDKETIERIQGQGVDLIRKIWNYLITPKAIDYLISELEEAFITVY